jgi:galactokinase
VIPPTAPKLDDLVAATRRGFTERFAASPIVAASAPGRINVIGEHTDYNDGLALPGAIDRWAVVALSPRDDDLMRIYSEAFGEEIEARLGEPTGVEASSKIRSAAPPRRKPRGDRDANPAATPSSSGRSAPRRSDQVRGDESDWAALPIGAGRLHAAAAGVWRGFDALIGGNVPVGAGVSSSAAVEMALLNALRAAFGSGIEDLELVRLGQRVEHEYLGVATGLMDQYTAQLSRPGGLMLIDFRELTHEHVDVGLDGWVWLLLDSGVRHELAASAYGERVCETRAALEQVMRADREVRSFRDLTEAHLSCVAEEPLRRRLRHYLHENERVRRAVDAVAAGEAAELGRLILASHASLRDDYAVSCPELDLLVEAAGAAEGCAGARMMGGGFGGCTINLVRENALDDVVAEAAATFRRRFGRAPGAGVFRLVGGATVHDLSPEVEPSR